MLYKETLEICILSIKVILIPVDISKKPCGTFEEIIVTGFLVCLILEYNFH